MVYRLLKNLNDKRYSAVWLPTPPTFSKAPSSTYVLGYVFFSRRSIIIPDWKLTLESIFQPKKHTQNKTNCTFMPMLVWHLALKQNNSECYFTATLLVHQYLLVWRIGVKKHIKLYMLMDNKSSPREDRLLRGSPRVTSITMPLEAVNLCVLLL